MCFVVPTHLKNRVCDLPYDAGVNKQVYDMQVFCDQSYYNPANVCLFVCYATPRRFTSLYSYYIQLSTMLCKQLHIIVHNVMHLLYDCPKYYKVSLDGTVTASVMWQF